MKETITFRLKLYLAVFSTLLVVGIAGFMATENMSLSDAVYFSIVTMATVGYGDIHPQTGMGKLLTLIVIIGGVGTFLGVIASITDLFVNRREELARQQKTDMITGLFFSEMGNGLLACLIPLDPDIQSLYRILNVSEKWKDSDFKSVRIRLKKHRRSILSSQNDMGGMLDFLQKNPNLLLRLIENPILQEHESFTELLRALLHLREELLNRYDLSKIPDSDRKHLENDMARVYNLLIFEWLDYNRYLKKNYGYLFSLAVRINPFDPDANAVVRNQ